MNEKLSAWATPPHTRTAVGGGSGGGGGGTLEAFARDPNVKMLLEGAAACRNVGERRGRGGGGGSKTVTGVNLNAFDNHAVIL